MRRHFDQVCQAEPGDRPSLRFSEVFDTVGLEAALGNVDVRPVPPDSQSAVVRWRTLDFISRYGRDGRPTATGVWETTLDPASALRVESILRARVRFLSGLLESEGFRAVVVFSLRPTVEVGAPVVCLPHVVHEAGKRPPGLPPDVATWLESSRLRPRAGTPGRGPTATVRIHLDRDGRVTAVDSLVGDVVVMAATRRIIAQLRFDPALRNGEAIAGELVQSFGFMEGYRPGR